MLTCIYMYIFEDTFQGIKLFFKTESNYYYNIIKIDYKN